MADISSNSRRIARNTIFLYLRMLLMMAIGLYTSRVVLASLGESDFGTYDAVSGIVMMFTILSASVSNAIGRFLAFEMGKNDSGRLRRVFSSAIIIITAMTVLLFILVETAGIWYLNNRLNVPAGREGASMWVLQMSAVMLAAQLFSVPFNSAIIAHEDMKVFAYISILEAALKLTVALLLSRSPSDKLVTYAILMAAVAIVVRFTYAMFCHRHYAETRGALVVDKPLMREMLSFSGWSFLGNGVTVMNTRGVTLLAYNVFGPGLNAARSVALTVENVVKQFATNFLTAINPQITKSWSSGDKDYCYEIVCKGCKFSYLILLLFVVPFFFESETILDLWLKDVPPHAASFTRLTLLCVLADMMCNSLFQLVLSTGRIAKYYIVTSGVNILVYILSFVAFRSGKAPESSYIILAGIYFLTDAIKLVFANRIAGLPVKSFLRDAVKGPAAVTLLTMAICAPVERFVPGVTCRLVLILLLGTASIFIFSYMFALTPGERDFALKTVLRWKK